MVDVPVSPAVLEWARTERGLSREKAAEALKLSLADLKALEAGNKQPSLGLLDRMSKKYQIPLATLLMPDPLPRTSKPRIPDFRTYAGASPYADQQLLTAIDAVNLQIDAFADLQDAHPDAFEGPSLRAYSVRDNPIQIAAAERNALGPTLDEQYSWEGAAQAFRRFRSLVEGVGVFVYLMDLGPMNLCRGFSIFDGRQIPVAVINGDESESAARTFTLFHEYGHILVRQTGISDQNPANLVEAWCNQFAAHYLMPRDAFVAAAHAIDPSGKWIDARVRDMANVFKVSMRAIALHLEHCKLVPGGFYAQAAARWSAKQRRPGGKPIPYAERQVNRLGVRHLGVVMSALERGYLNQVDAYELTDVAPKHYREIRKELDARLASYGGDR